MFTCTYCGTQFLEHKPNCPNCGAAIKIDSVHTKRSADQDATYTTIYQICDRYQGDDSIHFDDTINPARMKSAVTNLNIPGNEKVIMLYDDTVFSSNNKVGFAICGQGLYWKNDWSVETKRNYLAWEEFSKREIAREGLHISLGKGDRMGVAGCGSDETRDNIEKMLNEIKSALSK
ncbi:MAG: hypothetical protein H7Y59_14535 [Anaerolineales bacterium]|nr:hypothetical protein [Anaerolineales bacterium]